jgi:hypothetical protein
MPKVKATIIQRTKEIKEATTNKERKIIQTTTTMDLNRISIISPIKDNNAQLCKSLLR